MKVLDSVQSGAIAASAGSGVQLIGAPGAGQAIYLYGLYGGADAAGSMELQDDQDNALTGVIPFAQNGQIAWQAPRMDMPLLKVPAGRALEANLTTMGFDGFVQYAIVTVDAV